MSFRLIALSLLHYRTHLHSSHSPFLFHTLFFKAFRMHIASNPITFTWEKFSFFLILLWWHSWHTFIKPSRFVSFSFLFSFSVDVVDIFQLFNHAHVWLKLIFILDIIEDPWMLWGWKMKF
jgi:hypothetical protein